MTGLFQVSPVLGTFWPGGKRTDWQQCFGTRVHCPCWPLRSCGRPFPRQALSWAEGSFPEASGFANSVILETVGWVQSRRWAWQVPAGQAPA